MKIIFIFMWFAFTFSKNIILIGDLRTYLMAVRFLDIPINAKYSINNNNPYRYKGHSIYVIAKKGASINDFFSNSGCFYSELRKRIHDLYSKSPGTYVFLMLGINSIKNYGSIGKFYKDLAQVYKSVNFYTFSVVGINEGSSKNINDVTNNQILLFNQKLSHIISENKKYTPNLVFKDIVKDPLTLKNGQKVIKCLFDGINFNKEGSKIVFDLMIEGL